MPFTRLRYHLVTATTGRMPLITRDVEPLVHEALRWKAEDLGGKILYLGGIEDHIHMIAAIPPSIAVSKFIGDVKSAASRQVNRRSSKKYFKWQEGYGAFTVNPADMRDVVEYVLRQKDHHAHARLIDHYERLDL